MATKGMLSCSHLLDLTATPSFQSKLTRDPTESPCSAYVHMREVRGGGIGEKEDKGISKRKQRVRSESRERIQGRWVMGDG